jgi:hypothetical protein
VDTSEDTSTTQDDIDSGVPDELKSDLGPYWVLAQSSYDYVLSTISSYNNIEASKSTSQYGFNRGLKEFGQPGYEATVKELDDNLLGMGAVPMHKPNEVVKMNIGHPVSKSKFRTSVKVNLGRCTSR